MVAFAAIGLVIVAEAAQPSEFARLFAMYRGTEAEQAVRDFAAWSEVRVTREATQPPDTDDPRALAARALFHTEAGLKNETFGRSRTDLSQPQGGPWSSRWEVHYRTSQPLIDRVMQAAQRSGDAELLQFCRQWYIVANTTGMGITWFGSDFDALKRRAGESAEMQIVVGAKAVIEMGPQALEGPMSLGYDWGRKYAGQVPDALLTAGSDTFLAVPAREAELAFRRALKLDPTLTEARLRLGRVQQILNRKKEAQAEFEQIVRATTPPADDFSRYLAPLFLGAIYEDAGRFRDAVGVYRQSVASHPQGVSARIALGQALTTSGFADEGLAALRSIFGDGAGPHRPARDPFSHLAGLQDRKADERLATMRAMVSRTPRTPSAADPAVTRVVGDAPIEPTASADVRLDVVVTRDGKPVTGLTPSDFIVIDNFVRQSVTTARLAGKVSAALVLDTSASAMRETRGRSVTALAESVLATLLPDDVVSVVSASDRIALLGERLRAPAARAVLADVRSDAGSMTALWDAVLASRSLVMNTGGRPLVIVISDGADNISWFRRPRALAHLKRAGVAVDGIEMPWGIEGDCRRCLADFTFGAVTLRDLGAATGGAMFGAEDPALATRLRDRMAALRAGYVLTYTPTNMLTTAGWHDVKVTLKSGVAGKIEARLGYYGRDAK